VSDVIVCVTHKRTFSVGRVLFDDKRITQDNKLSAVLSGTTLK
jgi:hypothetical protein